jgi:hypothetical protein
MTTYYLWDHLNKMHSEVNTMKIDPSNHDEVKKFNDLFIEAYWLGCHLNIMERGNAQLFQAWAYDQRVKHGLSPLIPKTQYPLPDCVALTLPLHLFKERFFDFFEADLEGFNCRHQTASKI